MTPIETTEDFSKKCHPVAEHLNQIDWFIFGSINFSKHLSHQRDNAQRAKRFFALMNALAVFVGVKTKKLVYFQNNEVKPETDFHHIHFLLAHHHLEQFGADAVCDFLAAKAKELGMPDSVFRPFDKSKDGVGYTTKKVFKQSRCGRYTEMPLDYHPSKGLERIWREREKLE